MECPTEEQLATPGLRVSEQMPDSCSYRYGIVSVGGQSRSEALARAGACRRDLHFQFNQERAVAARTVVYHGRA